MSIKIIIPGVPVPKARPRVTRGGFTYTPKKTRDYEQLVKDIYSLKGEYLGESAIVAEIDLYFPIPKSYLKKRRQAILNGEEKYIKKPDLDNCIKSILDALNGIAYKDDSQIIEIRVRKSYTDQEPRAEVRLLEVF